MTTPSTSTATRSAGSAPTTWVRVCALDDLVPDRGAAALVGDQQVALFRLSGDDVPVRAVGHRDPYAGSNVMARGLVGSVGDVAVVASPLLKQRFRLDDGRAVEEPEVGLGSWPVRVVDGIVEVGATPVVRPAAPGTSADADEASADADADADADAATADPVLAAP
ncbi:nitrite reductase (NADH) small subunit [Mumia flava]|uniref:Nitrite reductase (NADH) small subunit n=1 Tax=Mumia flava TaxID=1348852 RepID=A0A2M9BE57_9ACTN|nr:nitrite reductase small subunit NirD [Mumia flava]PJJ56241.1 nitrite reductase (NADH) small subunit [Mumia flava]